MARVLGLLPFFVMGLKATPERLELLRRTPAQVAAVGVLVGIWILTTWTDVWASTEWLYYRSRYDEMGYADDVRALLTRALVLAIGTLGAWAFFALVPRVGGWFARMGAATLVVYLFHGFVVKGAGYAGLGRLGRRPRGHRVRRDHGRRGPAVAGARLAAGRRRGSTTSSTRSGTPSGTCSTPST